jgi:SAM-dependent methyltransferase
MPVNTHIRAEPHQASLQDELTAYYKSSVGYKDHLLAKPAEYFRPYVDVLSQLAPRGGRVLDLGCGTGQSTRALRDRGLRAVGCDLSALFLSAASPRGFVVGDATRLPFTDSSFDVVAGYEFIEHVPDVPAVLAEMCRVVKAGGFVVLSSPNLCSPMFVARDALRLVRGEFRPPMYSSRTQALQFLIRAGWQSARKWLRSRPEFLYRVPDLQHADRGGDFDAVYCSHPRDIILFRRRQGLRTFYAFGKDPQGARQKSVALLRRLCCGMWMSFNIVGQRPPAEQPR